MKSLKAHKKIAARIMKCSPKRVRFDTESLGEIKESITKIDLKGLIGRGVITKSTAHSQSRVRARKKLVQKRKGLRKGHGSRKGTANARLTKKEQWINRIRKQRELLKSLRGKNKIKKDTYRQLANKAKGGFFRSIKHVKIYLEENKLFIDKGKIKK